MTAATRNSDPRWSALVADYRVKHAQWSAASDTDRARQQAYYGALDALADYRVSDLNWLAEKIEIIGADYEEGDVPHQRLAEILADVRYLAAALPANDERWKACEAALAKAEADLEALAEPYTDAECDRLADIRGDAIDAILALPATTAAQAIRKLELAMFDEQMVRARVDYPALLADAKRLAGETRQ